MNSTLVDRLHDALIDEVYDGSSGALTDDQFAALVRKLAETAAAVFEKAHTPTDDEREALWKALRRELVKQDISLNPVWLDRSANGLTAAAFAAGFRRSEVPEPSAEDNVALPKWPAPKPRDDDATSGGVGWEDIAPEPQGEQPDVHLSNVSINGVRQTWQQLYEREHEAHVALQGYRTMLADLDRNASGRHQGDYDSYATGNGGVSAGNPHLITGQIIGYDIGGREYVVPEPRDRGTLSAWMRRAGGEER